MRMRRQQIQNKELIANRIERGVEARGVGCGKSCARKKLGNVMKNPKISGNLIAR